MATSRQVSYPLPRYVINSGGELSCFKDADLNKIKSKFEVVDISLHFHTESVILYE